MAQPIPTSEILTTPIAVVGPQYCISELPLDLVIVRKGMVAGSIMVTDNLENVMFKLQLQVSLHRRQILFDHAENPIVTIRQKMKTMHRRWHAFRGDSHEKEDLLFTAKTRSWVQLKTKIDVFLANNKKEHVPDFSLEESYDKSCSIYTGDGKSKTVIAQMHMNIESTKMTNLMFGVHNLIVTVYPNVDYAFVVTLILILNNINVSMSNGANIAGASSGLVLVI